MAKLPKIFQNRLFLLLIPITLGVLLAFIVSRFETDNWLKLEQQILGLEVETSFGEAPIYVGSLRLPNGDEYKPNALCANEHYYLLTYHDLPYVDMFSQRFEYIRRLDLSTLGDASITDIDSDDEHIYITDSRSGSIRIHNYSGELTQSIDWLPDGRTRLRPFGITLFDGVLYVSDRKLQQIMAINIMEKPSISEPGELIFSAPKSSGVNNNFFAPGFPAISPDGRLLVPTLEPPNVRAFTCSGRDMGFVINPDGNALKAPQGIAFDNIPSPGLLAKADSVFDPSGILAQGRMHIADSKSGDIHVYDPTGTLVLTYGKELIAPINLVIDNKRRIIVISDSMDPRLKIYKF